MGPLDATHMEALGPSQGQRSWVADLSPLSEGNAVNGAGAAMAWLPRRAGNTADVRRSGDGLPRRCAATPDISRSTGP